MLTSLIFKRKIYSYFIFTWAIITAYSRIYLGVHYPLDVFSGAIIGTLAALICYFAIRKMRPSLLIHTDYVIEKSEVLVPVTILSISFIAIFGYSIFF